MTTLATRLKVAGVAAFLGLNMAVLTPDIAFAQRELDNNQNCTQWQIEQGFCEGNFRSTVLTALNLVLGFLGLTAVAFLVYGGFLYVTAGASDDNVDQAKKIIIYAVIGIVVIFIAFALINTLIGGLGNQGNELSSGGAQ